MKCIRCGLSATVFRTINGIRHPFCEKWCADVYSEWLKVPKAMVPWAEGIHKILNEIRATYPHDQGEKDFYQEWFSQVTFT